MAPCLKGPVVSLPQLSCFRSFAVNMCLNAVLNGDLKSYDCCKPLNCIAKKWCLCNTTITANTKADETISPFADRYYSQKGIKSF